MKYTPPKPLELPRIPAYQLPPDPFKDVPAPIQIFLKKSATGYPYNYEVCPKEEAEIIAYTPKEHDKIVLRIQYYKEIVPQLENLVNVHIRIANSEIDLIIDQQLAKEVYKEMWIDTTNAKNKQSSQFGLEKYGLYGVIIGLIIEAAILAAH
jgi:hypothetical protein